MPRSDSNPAPAPREPEQLGRRAFVLGAVGACGAALLAGRLGYVQAFDPKGMAENARKQRQREEVLPALRGEITDINGVVLARSVQRYTLVADQSAVADYSYWNDENKSVTVTPTELVYQLTDILRSIDSSIDDNFVKSKLDGTSRYSVIKTNVPPAVYDRIAQLQAPYIYGTVMTERLYPNGSLAGSVVGRYSIVDEAIDGSTQTRKRNNSVGIERVYDEALTGKDGKRTYEISAAGVRIPVAQNSTESAVNGKTVRLTINQDIQYFAQQVISERARQLNAEWGTAVVMDVRDGSILAMADSSMMDPSAETIENAFDMTPRAISMGVEPGSTEKILTSSALIEEGITTPRSVYDVPATLTVNGQTFTDAFTHPAQRRTFSGIITDSMNTGTVLVGQKLEKRKRWEWLKKYGMGEYTGIELTGEQRGLVPEWRQWDGRQEFTVLFGQGVSQTPLQTTMIFQALANKGIKLKPRIVDAVIDPDGTVHKQPVAEGTRMVSESTARDCLTLMENVVEKGHVQDARVAGYRVGGKTGTAEAPDEEKGGYRGYTTSFVGVAPLDNPRFVVSLTLQRPQGQVGLIGVTSQFSKIMEKVLQTYKVPRSTTEPDLIEPLVTDNSTQKNS